MRRFDVAERRARLSQRHPIRVIGYVQAAEWTGRWPEIATALCVWIALPLVAGAARTIRRDVS